MALDVMTYIQIGTFRVGTYTEQDRRVSHRSQCRTRRPVLLILILKRLWSHRYSLLPRLASLHRSKQLFDSRGTTNVPCHW